MKRIVLTTCIAIASIQLHAQDFSLSEVGSVEMEQKKDTWTSSFSAGGTHYFLTGYYESASKTYTLQSVGEDGSKLQSNNLTVEAGGPNDRFNIMGGCAVGNQAYALVENFNSTDGERTISLRKLEANGSIENSGTDLLMINFQKVLRPGRLTTATSPNGKRIAAVGVLPFNKKASTKIKVAVFDENLKEISSGEFELEGLAIKGARYEAVVANDGTVYINRYTWKSKDGIRILVHQYDPESSSITETYSIDAPEKRSINTYMYTTNDNNELIAAVSLTAAIGVSDGNTPEKSIIIFRNEGKNGTILEVNDYETSPKNFEMTGLFLSGETIFVTGENTKEDKSSPANATPTTANTTYSYEHGAEHILGFNMAGQKMFELEIDQEMSARNSKHSVYSAAQLVNGKLVYIYNDLYSKYHEDGDVSNNSIIPVAVTVDNTGLMTPAVPFKNDLKLTRDFRLLPIHSEVSGNTITLLERKGSTLRAARITVE